MRNKTAVKLDEKLPCCGCLPKDHFGGYCRNHPECYRVNTHEHAPGYNLCRGCNADSGDRHSQGCSRGWPRPIIGGNGQEVN